MKTEYRTVMQKKPSRELLAIALYNLALPLGVYRDAETYQAFLTRLNEARAYLAQQHS